MMNRRRAFTVVEIMIAMVVTMIVVLAVVRLFKQVGDAVAESRTTIEMAGQARNISQWLRDDLDQVTQVTLPVQTAQDTGAGMGYFEYLEGPGRDRSPLQAGDNIVGDVDDVIMMTCRSRGKPFLGRLNGVEIESQLAEVIWWTRLNDTNGNNTKDVGEDYSLYRRVLLIRPDLNRNGVLVSGAANLLTYYQNNDISVHINSGNLVANSLSDLTRREYRFGHSLSGFPYPINYTLLSNLILQGGRAGEDLVSAHVMSFDVKAFDPTAVVRGNSGANNTLSLTSGDRGYGAPSLTQIGRGAYINLGDRISQGQFSGVPHARSGLSNLPVGGAATYCTWTNYYEYDNVDQFPRFNGRDNAVNNVDDNGDGVVDDSRERETSPPYLTTLRGIEVGIRIIDNTAKQVRHVTVKANFVPE